MEDLTIDFKHFLSQDEEFENKQLDPDSEVGKILETFIKFNIDNSNAVRKPMGFCSLPLKNEKLWEIMKNNAKITFGTQIVDNDNPFGKDIKIFIERAGLNHKEKHLKFVLIFIMEW